MSTILVYHAEVSEDEEVHSVKYINSGLKNMQDLVGGYLEVIRPAGLPNGIDMWINEEGRLINLPCHRNPFYHEPIFGNWFLARHNDAGDTVSLTMNDIAEIVIRMKFWRGDFG